MVDNARNEDPGRNGRNQRKTRRFSIKGSNSSGGPSKYEIAYDLRRCGRRFARGIHNSVRLCGTGVGTLRTYESDDGPRATVSARHNCHSAWACPVCSPKVAAARQRVLAPQVVRLLERGYSAHLVTLTLRHGRGDDLGYLFDGLNVAWKAMTSGRAWKDWRTVDGLSVEYVRGLDLTWSLRNWWHPHLHAAIYLPPGHDGDLEWFIERWIKCLQDEGFVALREAQDAGRKITIDSVKEAEKITAYAGATAAMPTAEALGMAMKKNRAEGSFSPFEILARAAAGDAFFEKRWKEYLEATKGRRQVTTSRGLKLNDDKDLTLADDVATLGPEAKEEAECSGMIPALLSAARCADPAERRVSVASVLSRLVARDWRMLEPKRPPPPDLEMEALVSKVEAEEAAERRRWTILRAWEISRDRRSWREMRRPRPGCWAPDPDARFELIPEQVRVTMPDPGEDRIKWVGLRDGGEDDEYVWVIESLSARRRLPPVRPSGPPAA